MLLYPNWQRAPGETRFSLGSSPRRSTKHNARVVELADTLVLEISAARLEGSTPSASTKQYFQSLDNGIEARYLEGLVFLNNVSVA